MDETDVRLAIIPKFLALCNTSLFEAMLLTGSMVFGKHYSVRKDSDIDVICVMEPSKVAELMADPFFGGLEINDDLIGAFAAGLIDRFWLDYFLDDIKINIGIWDEGFVDRFTATQADIHALGSLNANVQHTRVVDAMGHACDYIPTIEPHGTIYIKTFQLKHGGVLVSSPSYNNLIASETLYDPQGAYERKVAALIKRLNERYGDTWQRYFLEYVMKKSSPSYAENLVRRLSASA